MGIGTIPDAAAAAAFAPLTAPIPVGGVNIDLLREEVVAAFAPAPGEPGRAVGCNLTGYNPTTTQSATVTAYLAEVLAGDEAVFASVVAAHNPLGLSTGQLAEREQGIDFADLRSNVASVLADAATALTQIDLDFTSLASDIATLNAATTLAQARPPIVDSMQILTRTLNRQRRIIQSLVYTVRVIRWFVG